VKQYEYIQETRLDREDNVGFLGEATIAAVWSRYMTTKNLELANLKIFFSYYIVLRFVIMFGSYKIEEQASRFYTKAAFAKFREMMEMTTAYSIYPVVGDGAKYELDRNDPRAKKIRIVSYEQQEDSYMCTCNRFNVNGMLCHHILKVMVHTNVQEIPEKYLLHRWSEAATVCEAKCNREFTGYSIVPETKHVEVQCPMQDDE
jgi:hypothetical protein